MTKPSQVGGFCISGPPMTTDADLLKVYMAHVIDAEGVSFVDAISNSLEFTPEQRARLQAIEVDVYLMLSTDDPRLLWKK